MAGGKGLKIPTVRIRIPPRTPNFNSINKCPTRPLPQRTRQPYQLGIDMPIIRYENGMTVAELKQLIVNWSDTDDCGNPCEVWIGDNRTGLSNVVKEACSLNSRSDPVTGEEWSDFMLSSD